ncbi:penicillin-binding protein 1A [Salmonella enterica subsp. enterica]|nr:penicillin-binding protein 1A [Salmonella enterica subsp. enterica]
MPTVRPFRYIWKECVGARPYRSDTQQGPTPRKVTDVVQTGQQIWVRQVDNDWWLAQVPEVNSALVSLNPQTGAVLALVGGFDFNQSKFNRATQALRQVGSNIKPFLYTAAMDKGLTLASMLNDVPISRWDAGAGSDWRPKNSPPQYAGPIRLRQGLGQSKNVVMVRAMRAMGVDYAAEYLQPLRLPGAEYRAYRIAGAGLRLLSRRCRLRAVMR